MLIIHMYSFEYQGLTHEIFIAILRGLSGTKVTRPGKFRSSQDGYAVKSSLKAEDGVLYPLEKSFFFLPKPPALILHEEVYLFFLLVFVEVEFVLMCTINILRGITFFSFGVCGNL